MMAMTEAPSALALTAAGLAILLLLFLAALLTGPEPPLGGRGRGEARGARLEERDRLASGQVLGASLATAGAAGLAAWLGGTLLGAWALVAAILAVPLAVVALGGLLHPAWPADGEAGGIPWRIAASLAPLAALLRGPGHGTAARPGDAGAMPLAAVEAPAPVDRRARLLDLLDLRGRRVEEVMMHRRDIEMLDADAPPAEIFDRAINSPHTRLPVFRGNPENIVGVIHAKDLSRAVHRFVREHRDAATPLEGFDILDVTMEPYFIPESTPLDEQLRAFLRRRSHFALVIDEYGALQGLVTLEDILEEIVGDIADEHDVEEPDGIEPQDDGSVIVDGSLPIRDLNRALDWTLPDEEANTIAGLVIHEAQAIPSEGQAFSFHGLRVEVLAREGNRLARLRVQRLD
jgi:Mg2+/Co2+ transporter CorB